MNTEEIVRSKYEALSPAMNERSRRLWAATEAAALGRGGMALVMRASGVAFHTVRGGVRGTGAAEPHAAGGGTTSRRGTKEGHDTGPRLGPGPGSAGRTGHSGRSGISV